MRKSTALLCLAFCIALSLPVSASPLDPAITPAEWKRTRLALEKAGFKVNHFAHTPEQIRREIIDLRVQIERENDPTRNRGMARFGGGNPVAPTPRIRKAPAIGKLGATRKIN